jgi:heme-degrading monooxygenase HmoA
MFVVMNRLRCARGYAEHLERAFGHAGNMENVAGCAGFQFLRKLDSASETDTVEYIALTTWRDEAAYTAWSKSESFAATGGSAGESPVTAIIECYEVLGP